MLHVVFLLEDVVAFLRDRTEPGPEGRAFLSFDVLRKLPANLTCHCRACRAHRDGEEEDDVQWG